MSSSELPAASPSCHTLLQSFLKIDGLPFAEVLSEGGLEGAVRDARLTWNDRIFTPLITLRVFLGQVLAAEPSCRAAVARLIAHRVSQRLKPCSSGTGAYCQARKRLPKRFFSAVARLVGRNLDAQVDQKRLWKGRRVYLYDGSSVAMPDTPENQAEYPQPTSQAKGLGFPIMRAIASPCGGGAKLFLACKNRQRP